MYSTLKYECEWVFCVSTDPWENSQFYSYHLGNSTERTGQTMRFQRSRNQEHRMKTSGDMAQSSKTPVSKIASYLRQFRSVSPNSWCVGNAFQSTFFRPTYFPTTRRHSNPPCLAHSSPSCTMSHLFLHLYTID